MPRRDVTFALNDILEGIATIEDYTLGLSEEGFVDDRKTFDARLLAGILLVGPSDRHDLLDFYDLFLSFDNIKNRK